MKKLILPVAIALLTLASCKKDRTCTCTSTHVSQTVNGVSQPITDSPTKKEMKLTKVSKGSADCKNSEETTSFTGVFGGNQYTIIDVTKNECSLD